MTGPPAARLLPCARPPAHGAALGTARLRSQPADFRVRERLGFEADGEGPHLLLRIRKTGLTTDEAIRAIAAAWAVPARDIGHAGRKDRDAVTEQWLTVPWPLAGALPAPGRLAGGLELLEAARHRRKLRVGALTGNAFRLVLREVAAAPAAVDRRLARLVRYGVPNYFGPQRFGRGGANVDKALAWMQDRLRVRGRGQQGLLLSAARSECFNRVLAARVGEGSWDRAGPDDLMVLDGRGSLFAAADEAPAALARRTARLEIHPTGPLPGSAGPAPGPAVARQESEALRGLEPLVDGLQRRQVTAARRSLRLRVERLAWHWPEPHTLVLEFGLTAGGYATSVAAELFEL
ncbi:tRNA pseudouridine(13) synthase TruD [Spiribacter halobius]|uniref:tRNA pseudouridine synthase D n=1 Tax=Sediminicurvatus halobius TaxID=2182432 RepID=A0A2U2N4G7_9GAMM|nr:tRNA pseudouridine(13) synthase TruD [Spiribacter halobius]PWG63928.1 tRNA pseudouridine(13) synthase TruD [Spiribacter halobius]UEX76342.1 tRNA pseudouridine(13) synthase TruD [Spiribacter halobius]